MILTAILNLAYVIIYTLTYPLRYLNDVTLPTSFVNSMTTASGYLSIFNVLIPLDDLLIILTIFIIIEGAYLAYKGIMWVVKRFPTQS